MLKRNLIIIAILTIAFTLTSNVFGQNTKSKTAKNARITKRPNQATGGTIPVYKNGKSQNSAQNRTKLRTQRSPKTKGVWQDDWYPTTNSIKSKNKSAAQRRPNRRKH